MDNTDGNRAFSYDVLDRLTEVVNPYVADQFTYDPLGNLRSASELGTFAYDTRNRVASRSNGGHTFFYSWDARGNLLGDTERSFSWNLANELVANSHGTQFAYDVAGDGLTEGGGSLRAAAGRMPPARGRRCAGRVIRRGSAGWHCRQRRWC